MRLLAHRFKVTLEATVGFAQPVGGGGAAVLLLTDGAKGKLVAVVEPGSAAPGAKTRPSWEDEGTLREVLSLRGARVRVTGTLSRGEGEADGFQMRVEKPAHLSVLSPPGAPPASPPPLAEFWFDPPVWFHGRAGADADDGIAGEMDFGAATDVEGAARPKRKICHWRRIDDGTWEERGEGADVKRYKVLGSTDGEGYTRVRADVSAAELMEPAASASEFLLPPAMDGAFLQAKWKDDTQWVPVAPIRLAPPPSTEGR